MVTAEPFNALLLSNPRFGLTIDELQNELSAIMANLKPSISFLPSGDVVVKVIPSSISWHEKTSVSRLKSSISKLVKDNDLASSTTLCAVDSNGKNLPHS